MIGLILIGVLILYLISLYNVITTVADWDIVSETQRRRAILMFFVISVVAFCCI